LSFVTITGIVLFYLFAETITTRDVGRHDAKMTSLCAAVVVLLRCVYDTLAAVIAVAFFLYAVIAFIAVGVVLDAGAPSGHGLRHCRQPVGSPSDVRPSVVTASPRCTANATVSRTFSETKV